jgi:hypothetical protein
MTFAQSQAPAGEAAICLATPARAADEKRRTTPATRDTQGQEHEPPQLSPGRQGSAVVRGKTTGGLPRPTDQERLSAAGLTRKARSFSLRAFCSVGTRLFTAPRSKPQHSGVHSAQHPGVHSGRPRRSDSPRSLGLVQAKRANIPGPLGFAGSTQPTALSMHVPSSGAAQATSGTP